MKGASDCLHDVTMYLYYALCFLLVEHSVCNEPISVLINIYIYIYIKTKHVPKFTTQLIHLYIYE